MKKQRMLIIYTNAGEGHKRQTRILEEIFSDVPDLEIQSVPVSELADDSKSMLLIESVWNFLLGKGFFRTADLIVNHLTRLITVPLKQILLGDESLNLIQRYRPDIIISTMSFINKELGEYARKNKIRFFIFMPDVGAAIDTPNPSATHICLFNEAAQSLRSYDFNAAFFKSIGDYRPPFKSFKYLMHFIWDHWLNYRKHPIYSPIDKNPPSKNDAVCFSIGPLIEKYHYDEFNVQELKSKYGISPEFPSLAIVNGSSGGKPIVDMVKAIEKHHSARLNVICLCGKDERTYEYLSSYRSRNGNLRIYPFRYTRKINELLSLSDCVICRLTTGAIMEAITHQSPVIVKQTNLSNDKGTLKVIKDHGLGMICRNDAEIARSVKLVLSDLEIYRKNISKLQREYPNSYSEKTALVRKIVLGPS